MVTEQERLNPKPVENVTFLDKTKEKGKELLRNISGLLAPQAEYAALRTGDPQPGLADNIRADIDREEAEDTEARDFVEDVSREEVANYVSDQEATLDRRRKDAEGIMDQYGGTIITDKIRNPRLEKIQEEMSKLNLSTNQQGEENATNR